MTIRGFGFFFQGGFNYHEIFCALIFTFRLGRFRLRALCPANRNSGPASHTDQPNTVYNLASDLASANGYISIVASGVVLNGGGFELKRTDGFAPLKVENGASRCGD